MCCSATRMGWESFSASTMPPRGEPPPCPTLTRCTLARVAGGTCGNECAYDLGGHNGTVLHCLGFSSRVDKQLTVICLPCFKLFLVVLRLLLEINQFGLLAGNLLLVILNRREQAILMGSTSIEFE